MRLNKIVLFLSVFTLITWNACRKAETNASTHAGIRTLRIVDGPDEVHLRDIARLELKSYLP